MDLESKYKSIAISTIVGTSSHNMKQASPEKLAKPVSTVTTRQFPPHQAQREWPSSYDWIGCSALRYLLCLFRKFSRVLEKGNPDVLKLFHRHSVWMIRFSVLVKVNGIRHYFFIDLILPCFSHKQLAKRAQAKTNICVCTVTCQKNLGSVGRD